LVHSFWVLRFMARTINDAKIGIPGELLAMAPYIATMIVLAGFIGRVRMPAADGTPYEK